MLQQTWEPLQGFHAQQISILEKSEGDRKVGSWVEREMVRSRVEVRQLLLRISQVMMKSELSQISSTVQSQNIYLFLWQLKSYAPG